MLTINENANKKSSNLKKILAAVSSVAIIGIGATYVATKTTKSSNSKLSNLVSDNMYGTYSFEYDHMKGDAQQYKTKGSFSKSIDSNGEWDVEYTAYGKGLTHVDTVVLKDDQLYSHAHNGTFNCSPRHQNLGYGKYKYNLATATVLDTNIVTERSQKRINLVCDADSEKFIMENEDVGKLILCYKQSNSRTTVGVVGETFKGNMYAYEGVKSIELPEKFDTVLSECENTDKFLSIKDRMNEQYEDLKEGYAKRTHLDIIKMNNFPFENNLKTKTRTRKLKSRAPLKAPELSRGGGRPMSSDSDVDSDENFNEFYDSSKSKWGNGGYYDQKSVDIPSNVIDVNTGGGKGDGGKGGDDDDDDGDIGWGGGDLNDIGNQVEITPCKTLPCPTAPPTAYPTAHPTTILSTLNKICHLFHGANSHKGYLMKWDNNGVLGNTITVPDQNPWNNPNPLNTPRYQAPHWDFPMPAGITIGGAPVTDYESSLEPNSADWGMENSFTAIKNNVNSASGWGIIPKPNPNWGGSHVAGDFYTSKQKWGGVTLDYYPMDNCDFTVMSEMNTAEFSFKTYENYYAAAVQLCGTPPCTVGYLQDPKTHIIGHSMGGMILMAAFQGGFVSKGINAEIHLSASPLRGSIIANFVHHVCGHSYGSLGATAILASLFVLGVAGALAQLIMQIVPAVIIGQVPRSIVKLSFEVTGVCNNDRTGGITCNRDLRLFEQNYFGNVYNQDGLISNKYCGLAPDGLEGFGYLWRATAKTMCRTRDYCLEMKCTTYNYTCHWRGCTPPSGWNEPQGLRKCRRHTNVLWNRWDPRNDNNVSKWTCLSNGTHTNATTAIQTGFVTTFGDVSHQGCKCKYGNGSATNQRPCDWYLLVTAGN